MHVEERPSLPGADDPDHEGRVRKFAWVVLVVLVVSLVGTMLVAGGEYLRVAAWMLIPGGIGVLGAIQMLRHPERVGRLPGTRDIDQLLARGGVDVRSIAGSSSRSEARLAIQDALDSLGRQQGTSAMRIAGRVAAAVGTLGWLAGAVWLWVVGHDVASAGICLVGSAAFGSLGVYLVRVGKRARRAEWMLERQLRSLEGGASPEMITGQGREIGSGERDT
jgi:hypothetical protein